MWHKQEPAARGDDEILPAADDKSARGAWALYMLAVPTAAIAGFMAFYFTLCNPTSPDAHPGLLEGVICAADPSGHRGGVRVADEGGLPANPAGPASEAQGLRKHARGSLSRLIVARAPREVSADAGFVDVEGRRHTLAEWKGKVVLLNIWATWCGPCKLEMPSLDRLQARMGGSDFTVLTVSVNRDGAGKPQAFFAENRIGALQVLNDQTGEFTYKMQAGGLPATLLLDREGREIARILGPAEWDSEEAQALIRDAVGR